MAPPASSAATATRRRSERRQLVGTSTASSARVKKPPRRSSKTDPSVKPLVFWSSEEVENLVEAWRATVAHPPTNGRRTSGGFNARMYARFVALCGGSTKRVLQSVISKKQLLNCSYQFIAAYNERRRTELDAQASDTSKSKGVALSKLSKKDPSKSAGGRGAADDTDGSVNYWFALSKPQRKATALRSFMPEQRQFALLAMDHATYNRMLAIAKLEDTLSVRQSWLDDDLDLLFRAWRAAITKRPKGHSNPLFSLNTRLYEFMVELGGSAFKRTKQSVVLKKETMRLSFEFIDAFNKHRFAAAAAAGDGKTKPVLWHMLSSREQECVVANEYPKPGFVYFTPTQFDTMATLRRDTEALASKHGMGQSAMWNHEEFVLLLKAWRDIADKPLNRLPANTTFGACIYERFLHLSNGARKRSWRSTLTKLESMQNMHDFIEVYNIAAARESRSNWFALDRTERRRLHTDAMRAGGCPENSRTHSFTDFDRAMVDTLTKIAARDRAFSAITYSDGNGKGQRGGLGRKRKSRGSESDDDDVDSDDHRDSESDDDVDAYRRDLDASEDDNDVDFGAYAKLASMSHHGDGDAGGSSDGGGSVVVDEDSGSDYAPTGVRRSRKSAQARAKAKARAKASRAMRRQTLSIKKEDVAAATDSSEDDEEYPHINRDVAMSERNDNDRDSARRDSTKAVAPSTGANSFLFVNSFEPSSLQQKQQQQLKARLLSMLDNDDDDDTSDASDVGSASVESTTSRHIRRAGATTSSATHDGDKNRPTSATGTRPLMATTSATPTPFSLHELADLAMRVNHTNTDESGVSGHDSDGTGMIGAAATAAGATVETRNSDGAGSIIDVAHAARDTDSSSRKKKRTVGADVVAMVQILHTQSMQMVHVMQEIRDEIRLDRQRFLDEMRLLREETLCRRGRDASDDAESDDKPEQRSKHSKRQRDSNDDSDDEDKRAAGNSKTQQTAKRGRRISVQRNGFIVKL